MSNKKNNRRFYLVVLSVVVIGLIFYFILNKQPDKVITTQTEAIDIPFTKQGELFFINKLGQDTLATIEIEVADDEQSRARGLMYRRTLPENAGMLFLQDREEMQSFWMKNTYIRLDILFVNAHKEIVTIHANTTPLKEWSYASTEPALYVVEVNAGFTNQHEIHIGDKIEYVIQ